MTDTEKVKLIKEIIGAYWECGDQTAEASDAILIVVHTVASLGEDKNECGGGNAP